MSTQPTVLPLDVLLRASESLVRVVQDLSGSSQLPRAVTVSWEASDGRMLSFTVDVPRVCVVPRSTAGTAAAGQLQPQAQLPPHIASIDADLAGMLDILYENGGELNSVSSMNLLLSSPEPFELTASSFSSGRPTRSAAPSAVPTPAPSAVPTPIVQALVSTPVPTPAVQTLVSASALPVPTPTQTSASSPSPDEAMLAQTPQLISKSPVPSLRRSASASSASSMVAPVRESNYGDVEQTDGHNDFAAPQETGDQRSASPARSASTNQPIETRPKWSRFGMTPIVRTATAVPRPRPPPPQPLLSANSRIPVKTPRKSVVLLDVSSSSEVDSGSSSESSAAAVVSPPPSARHRKRDRRRAPHEKDAALDSDSSFSVQSKAYMEDEAFAAWTSTKKTKKIQVAPAPPTVSAPPAVPPAAPARKKTIARPPPAQSPSAAAAAFTARQAELLAILNAVKAPASERAKVEAAAGAVDVSNQP